MSVRAEVASSGLDLAFVARRLGVEPDVVEGWLWQPDGLVSAERADLVREALDAPARGGPVAFPHIHT